MEYFRILNLAREPFSSSPEPDFFYESLHHVECLQKLELVLRLRRGLSVVIGQVGAGKTTLSRQLIRKFAADPDVNTHLMLDPHFSTEHEFLTSVATLFGIRDVGKEQSPWQIREQIKNHLFQQAVERKKLVVLIIDEGQKIPDFAMESLREFLNYETNETKLLQIAVFAQEEFRENLERHPGFKDRINLTYNLGPLNYNETHAMVNYRLHRASGDEKGAESITFTAPAMRLIYRETGGYPRKIVRICHQVLLAMIIKNRDRVDWRLVKDVIRRSGVEYKRPVMAGLRGPVLAAVVVVFLGVAGMYLHGTEFLSPRKGVFLWSTKAPVTTEESRETLPYRYTYGDQSIQKEPGSTLHGQAWDSGYAARLSINPELMTLPDEPMVEPLQGEAARKPVDEPVSIPPEDVLPKQAKPDALGTIQVSSNQFVCRMLRNVYGVCDNSLKRSFQKANPHIRDLDHVMVGQTVTIPAVVDTRNGYYGEGLWVLFHETKSLADAYTFQRALEVSETKVRILPYWIAGRGMTFAVILREVFEDEAAARDAMDELWAMGNIESEIIESWPREAVFFGKR